MKLNNDVAFIIPLGSVTAEPEFQTSLKIEGSLLSFNLEEVKGNSLGTALMHVNVRNITAVKDKASHSFVKPYDQRDIHFRLFGVTKLRNENTKDQCIWELTCSLNGVYANEQDMWAAITKEKMEKS